MKRVISLLMLAALFSIAFAPAAEAACEKTSLLDIQDEVMCVICGVPLINAGGPQSDDQRDFIRERVEQCETKEEIKAALVAEYTTAVLAVPQKSGFDLSAYLVPILALIAALIAIVVGAIGWKRSRGSDKIAAATPAEDDALDEDLRRYDL
ncbi:MAG: cytochrome c-type biogenesis protein CcmH [Solirubrobacterales bacterium]